MREPYTVYKIDQAGLWDTVKLVRQSLDIQAYHWLRDEILSGAMAAGKHLVQDELAEKLGISRLPIRDAIRQLAAEGLLEAGSQGYVVRSLSVEDIIDAYDVRLCVEGLAARKCALAAPDEQVALMGRILDRMDANFSAGDFEANVRLDYQFHAALYEFSGSPTLMRLSSQLWGGIPPNAAPWLVGKSIGDKWREGLQRSASEHRAIFAAIAERDGGAAEAAAELHVANARDSILRNRCG